jgi:hypothetical protein
MEEPLKVVPICDGSAHLQNSIEKYSCVVCGKLETDDMFLLRGANKNFYYACPDHPGIIQEFLRQYRRIPLGWTYRQGEQI